jgi:hypothetical protein
MSYLDKVCEEINSENTEKQQMRAYDNKMIVRPMKQHFNKLVKDAAATYLKHIESASGSLRDSYWFQPPDQRHGNWYGIEELARHMLEQYVLHHTDYLKILDSEDEIQKHNIVWDYTKRRVREATKFHNYKKLAPPEIEHIWDKFNIELIDWHFELQSLLHKNTHQQLVFIIKKHFE